MGRFERDDSDAGQLPETLGVATEGLRSTIEAEVARIIETAEARAVEIEDRALEKASRVEQRSDRRRDEVFQHSRARVGEMLAQLDTVEQSLGEAVRSLRTEAQRLTDELSNGAAEPYPPEPPPAPPPEPEPAPEPETVTATMPDVNAEVAVADTAAPEPQSPVLPESDPEVRGLIRQQLVSLAEAGRTRADAERMLLRFRQGEQYFDLLDEIYPATTPGRRGLLRRRKAAD